MSDHPPLPPYTVEDLSHCEGWEGIGRDEPEEVGISLGGIIELTFKSVKNNAVNDVDVNVTCNIDVNCNINIHEGNNKDHDYYRPQCLFKWKMISIFLLMEYNL